MASRMEEFKDFVRAHPKLKTEVVNGKRTWQSIYEEWVLYGDNGSFDIYKDNDIKKEEGKQNTLTLNMDTLKNVLGYVKKINPDDLNRSLNTVQKVIQIVQTIGGSKRSAIGNVTGSIYNDWWD